MYRNISHAKLGGVITANWKLIRKQKKEKLLIQPTSKIKIPKDEVNRI
jgi:hypothetical protein